MTRPPTRRRLSRFLSAHGILLGTLFALASLAPIPPATAAEPPPALTNTYWRLVELRGQPVTVDDHRREPHLVLRLPGSGPAAVGGSAGCTRIAGQYEHHADRLYFHRVASTRMACTLDILRQEERFLDVLARAARYRIDGTRLLLLDSRAQVLAVFEPRYLT